MVQIANNKKAPDTTPNKEITKFENYETLTAKSLFAVESLKQIVSAILLKIEAISGIMMFKDNNT